VTNYMVKSGSGRICFTNPAPARFLKSKSGTALVQMVKCILVAVESLS